MTATVFGWKPPGGKHATELRGTVTAEGPKSCHTTCDEVPEYIDWLSGRLRVDDNNGNNWLRGQTLEQALEALEILGAVLEHGHQIRLPKLSAEQNEIATDIGFSIFREGPKAVEEGSANLRLQRLSKRVL